MEKVAGFLCVTAKTSYSGAKPGRVLKPTSSGTAYDKAISNDAISKTQGTSPLLKPQARARGSALGKQ